MSFYYNRIQLAGNLTRDPELKFTPQGTAVCKLGIAINREWKDASGEKKKEVSFFNITVWGKSAENCGKYLTKGKPIFVEGRLQTHKYKTQCGEERTATDIVADSVQFLGSAKDDDRKVVAPPTDESPELASEGDEVPF